MAYTDEQIGTLQISGDPARFVATEKVPISGLTMDLEPVQELHGYEYPWPAGGGVQLLNADNPLKFTRTISGISFGKMFPSGTPIYAHCSSFAYTTEPEVGAKRPAFVLRNSVTATNVGSSYVDEGSVTANGDFDTIRFYSNGNSSTNSNGVEVTIYDLIISTTPQTEWSPYENICPITGRDSVNIYVSPTPEIGDGTEIYEIDFDQTVYAGTLTINEDGSGTIVSNMASVDLGTLTWGYTDTYDNHLFYTNSISGMLTTAKLLSPIYKYGGIVSSSSEFSRIVDFSIVKWRAASRIYLVDNRYSDAESYKSAMAGVQLVYELAEPVTIQLDPIEITTLIGLNYVWTSENNLITLSFPYRKEIQPMEPNYNHCWTYPKAVIDKLIKRIEDLEDAVADLEAAKSGDNKAAETTEKEITEPVEETVTETKKGGK